MALNREAIVATAEKLVARGKLEPAIKEYRKLVADNPGDAMTINRLGDLYVRINRNEEAVKLFGQIAERYTDDGFFVKAIAIYKKIIKLDPTRLPVYEKLAELYHKQGLVTEARTQYQVLVDYYLKHGKIDSAESVLRKMTALDSGDPTPHVKLAEIFRDRGEHDKELQEYRLLAEMMLRHKRIDEAAQVYAKAIAAAPHDLGFITDAVLGLKDAGYGAAAAKLLALAVEKNPQAEKIARIAGIGERRKTDITGVRPLVGEPPRLLKVSDIATAPPELRAPPRPEVLRPELSRLEASRPDFLLEEIELELPESGHVASTQIQPTDEMMRRSSESPWFTAGETSSDLVLEIEGFEAAVAPLDAARLSEPEVAATPVAATEVEWSFEPEPDLALDLELPKIEPLPPLDSSVAPATVFVAAPAAVPAARRLGDLLAEAEVFRKHGLVEKAHDRLRQILHEEPRHSGALALATLILTDEGKFDRAFTRAQQLERLAGDTASASEAWESTRPKLERAGFRWEGGRLVAPPEPKKSRKDSVSLLLDELAGLAPKSAVSKPKAARPGGKSATDLSALVDGIAATVKAQPKPASRPAASPVAPTPMRPAEAAAPAAAPAAPAELVSWSSSAQTAPPLDGPAAEPPAAPAPLLDPEEAGIEDRLSWLDDAAARAAQRPPASRQARQAAADDLFEDEEGFFDLAAELEEELSKEDSGGKESLGREEPTLEEIVEGFKKGVAESLSPEDYDTHFNLGIAYREMGLIDEAIGEFQLAAKNENYLLDCCTLLGSCFLEKGLPELGIKWFQRGLATPNLTEDANLGLLYDLGNLYLTIGDHESARRAFVELYGINSNYRDAVAKLEELGSR